MPYYGTMNHTGGARLSALLELAAILEIPATALARELRRRFRGPARRRGTTLRPGPDTPLWLALVAEVEPHLRVRGAKARLARVLGLSPGRLREFFKARSAMPDAERTLFLLLWLAEKGRGRDKGQ